MLLNVPTSFGSVDDDVAAYRRRYYPEWLGGMGERKAIAEDLVRLKPWARAIDQYQAILNRWKSEGKPASQISQAQAKIAQAVTALRQLNTMARDAIDRAIEAGQLDPKSVGLAGFGDAAQIASSIVVVIAVVAAVVVLFIDAPIWIAGVLVFIGLAGVLALVFSSVVPAIVAIAQAFKVGAEAAGTTGGIGILLILGGVLGVTALALSGKRGRR